jgi:purine-nucleoside phosphorylase
MSQQIINPIEYLKSQKISFTSPKKIIICYLSNPIKSMLDELGFVKNPLWKRGILYEKNNIGIVVELGIGHPILFLAMHELQVLGAREFILLGLAGAINPNLKSGDIIDSKSNNIYSTDDPYKEETLIWLKKQKENNIDAVDMETTFFLEKSKELLCLSNSYLIIMDRLSETGWEANYNKELVLQNYKKTLRMLINKS